MVLRSAVRTVLLCSSAQDTNANARIRYEFEGDRPNKARAPGSQFLVSYELCFDTQDPETAKIVVVSAMGRGGTVNGAWPAAHKEKLGNAKKFTDYSGKRLAVDGSAWKHAAVKSLAAGRQCFVRPAVSLDHVTDYVCWRAHQ